MWLLYAEYEGCKRGTGEEGSAFLGLVPHRGADGDVALARAPQAQNHAQHDADGGDDDYGAAHAQAGFDKDNDTDGDGDNAQQVIEPIGDVQLGVLPCLRVLFGQAKISDLGDDGGHEGDQLQEVDKLGDVEADDDGDDGDEVDEYQDVGIGSVLVLSGQLFREPAVLAGLPDGDGVVGVGA